MSLDPIRTLIVDDEPTARAAIRSLLADDPELEVVGECNDGGSAVREIGQANPELVFLDVQMPGMDGFRVLERIEEPDRLVVIFVTAYDQYALEAFDVNAVDYLLKPFSDERFRTALSRAKREVVQRRLGLASDRLLNLLESLGRGTTGPVEGTPAGPPNYTRRLVIKTGGRIMILPVRDLDWIEAEGDYVKLHAGKAAHLLRDTMRHLETELDPSRFVRIHRSTIVNVERIKELQPYFRGEYVVVLHDGTNLKLSQGYKERLEGVLGRAF
jgi:two-component system LytT family response regulator